MSPFLLKIYGLLVIVTLILAGYLLSGKQVNTPSNRLLTTSHLLPNTTTSNFEKLLGTATNSIRVLEKAATKTGEQISKAVTTATQESDYTYTDSQKNPCSHPVYYKLGSFDSRFSITKSLLTSQIIWAAELWNTAAGKKIFIFDETGKVADLTINLVYDERQALTDKNKLLSLEIENTKYAAEELEKEYKALELVFEAKKTQYTLDVEAFTARQKKYNDDVESWNQKGGAPRTEYDALTAEKAALQKLAENLNQTRDELNSLLADINAKIARHNELVIFANQNIDINNSSANIKFTEGDYNSSTNQINIYQFTDLVKLKRVLAHEFGHAALLDHVTGKQSIMYSINTGSTTELSPEDMQAFKSFCMNTL